MRSRPRVSRRRRRGRSGGASFRRALRPRARFLLIYGDDLFVMMETRLLILNADPVFQDRAIAILDEMDGVETRIVRTLSDAISVLLAENFDGFVVEGEPAIAFEQATNARQHFPSLQIACLAPTERGDETIATAEQQKIVRIGTGRSVRQLRSQLLDFVRTLETHDYDMSEGIDPCHSLIGNLNQFSAAEILQMSCLGQRSGRFTFKSGRGNSEIYLQHGSVATCGLRHAGRRISGRGDLSAGARADFILKKELSARFKRSIARGPIC